MVTAESKRIRAAFSRHLIALALGFPAVASSNTAVADTDAALAEVVVTGARIAAPISIFTDSIQFIVGKDILVADGDDLGISEILFRMPQKPTANLRARTPTYLCLPNAWGAVPLLY